MTKKVHSISPQQLAQMGRGGDTMLAHINPQEAQMLKRMGGSGTINPKTGLPEFMFRDSGHISYMNDAGFGGGGGFDDFGGGNHYYNFEDTGGYGDFGNVSDFGNYDYYGDTGSGTTGGGAIDQGVNPDTGAVKMEFTGMADSAGDVYSPGDLDFGPGANTVPSGGVYDIFEQNPPAVVNFPDTPYTSPETPYTPLDVTPGPLPDWYTDPNTTADNYTSVTTTPAYTGPEITVPDYTAPIIDAPTLDLPDLTPYLPVDTTPDVTPETPYTPPVDDVPEITIVDDRPVTPVDDVPEITITDNRPITPVDDVPEIVITDDRPVTPVTPVVPEVPEIVITDDRPVPPVVPPVVPEPEVPEITIVDERPVPPVVPPVVPEPEVPEITIVDERPVPPVIPEPEIPEIEIVDERPTTCPSPEMGILLSDNTIKPAGNLAVGDTVKTQHEHTLAWGNHKVTHSEIIPQAKRLKIIFDNTEIISSYDHKFFNKVDSWLRAEDVKPGDILSGSVVQSIEQVEDGPVVRITIEDAHTYICQGLLSHNKSPLPPDEPPVIVDPPYEPPVLPPLPPVVPPVTPPPEPPVTPPPPPVPPTPPQLPTREMINPGFIQPRAFYNTTNDAQSKFFWGGHGPQFGTNQFDARAYNQAAAPSTPWGLGQVAAPLSPAEVQAAIEGRYVPRAGTPAATRAEAYQAATAQPYQYGQVQVGGPVSPTTATTTTPTGRTRDLYTSDQRSQISNVLGANWQRDLDNAALNGDYATIVRIQNQINSILNPVVDNP